MLFGLPPGATKTGNIGGTTLSPGIYTAPSTSLAVSSGNLTLDAQGDANAVWIFQVGTTLDVTPGLQVILANGAQASNIFWQVGSSATIDTTAVMQGNILGLDLDHGEQRSNAEWQSSGTESEPSRPAAAARHCRDVSDDELV